MIEYKRFISYLGDTQGPGIIRVILPYTIINSRNNIYANYDFNFNNDIAYIKNMNVIQFQRSCTEAQYEFIKKIKSTGKKIFYDIDDLITEVPEYNHAFDYYKKYHNVIKNILSIVDCIVCSTVELKKHFSKFNNTIVIQNRLIDLFWQQDLEKEFVENQRTKILWAGGSHHFSINNEEGDFSKEIIEYIEKTTNKYEWIFVGSLPLKLKNNKNITYYKWCHNYFDYIKLLKHIDADIGIALLQNNNFNKCKSNIKALEYVSLNIPGIYSKITPYNNMSLRVSTNEQFIDCLEKLHSNKDFYDRTRLKDRQTIINSCYWNENYINNYINNYLNFL